PPMRRPNHASRFEGIAKTNLQASRASDTETLQSQVNKAAKKRLSLSGLEILHGRLQRPTRLTYTAGARQIALGVPVPHSGLAPRRDADAPQFALLRARLKRPRRSAAEKRGQEFSAFDVARHVTPPVGGHSRNGEMIPRFHRAICD